MKATCVAAVTAVMILVPVVVSAQSAGNPAELLEPGTYQVGFEWIRTPHHLDSEETIHRGYLLKAQGSVHPRVNLYLRAGREGLSIQPGGSTPDFKGDPGFSMGGGIKVSLYDLPQWKIQTFLDIGVQGFRSEGVITSEELISGFPSTVTVENDYRWFEYEASLGARHDHGLISPYGGLRFSRLSVDVRRVQLSGIEHPTQSGSITEDLRYRAFAGLDFKLNRSLRLSVEMSRRWSDPRPAIAVALSERTLR